jgi:hypothetical protein
MFYFAYCTWMDEKELRRYSPTAVFVTKARAVNHKVEFRAAGDRRDRGWCHLSDVGDARGEVTYGLVYMLPEQDSVVEFDDFDICYLTVRGDDGNIYDCFTYRLSHPGVPMRPPNFYWQHIPDGAKAWNLPAEAQAKLLATHNAALPCPDADRPMPKGGPSKDAGTR